MGQVGDAFDALLKYALGEKVALDAPRSPVEVDRPTLVVEFRVAMNLRRQVVEHRHRVTALQHGVDQMRADETGTAGDEDGFVHSAAP